MNAIQEQTVSVLRELVSICRDGQEGFRKASECVADDPELKMLLSSFSLQRSKFAGELETELINLGEHDYEREGTSFTGAAHRGWMGLKAAVTRADNHSILAECERGEDAAVAAYNKALTHEIPDPVREIVQRQRQEVVATHNTIRALRDATPSEAAKVMESAREAARTAQKKGEQAVASASKAWDEMKSKADDWRDSTERYVRRNPLQALGGALLAGFTVGMIFYAVELRNESVRIEMQRRPWRRFGAILAAWFGFLASRARTGYRSSVSQVEDITSEASRRLLRPRNRFTRPFRRAWQRMRM